MKKLKKIYIRNKTTLKNVLIYSLIVSQPFVWQVEFSIFALSIIYILKK